MKKNLKTISAVRDDLQSLKGQEIDLQVCLGRKKTTNISGKLIGIYPSVFTIFVPNAEQQERSFSYTEILCGNVKVQPKNFNAISTKWCHSGCFLPFFFQHRVACFANFCDLKRRAMLFGKISNWISYGQNHFAFFAGTDFSHSILQCVSCVIGSFVWKYQRHFQANWNANSNCGGLTLSNSLC